MQELVLLIVKAIVDNPEQVSVKEIEGDRTYILELRVAKTDVGKVIGKQGRTAKSIRTIIRALSGKAGKRYMFEIVD